MEKESIDNTVHHGLRISGFALLLGVCLALAILHSIQANTSSSNVGEELAPRVKVRGFIALPSAGTISVQNLTAASVGMTIEYYSLTGQKILDTTDIISSEANTVFAKPEDFVGFARVNVDDELQAVNYELTEAGNDAYIGNYAALSQVSSSWCSFCFILPIPYVIKNHNDFSSKFTLQNYGYERATIGLDIYQDSDTSVFSELYEILANEAIEIDLAQLSGIPDNFQGSIILFSDQPLKVSGSVRTYNDPLGIRHSYPVNLQFEQKLYAPALFKNHNLQTSKLCVQNVSGIANSITVSYTDNLSATFASLPSGNMHCFDQADEAHADGWTGGATVVGSDGSNISGVVVVEARQGSQLLGSWSYQPANDDSLDNQKALAFPLLMSQTDNWSTTTYLYNPGSTPATVTPRYISQSGMIPCVDNFEIGPGAVYSIAPNTLPTGLGQGMAYFLSDQPLAGASGATSSRALGDTDRHFGYLAASNTQSITANRPCSQTPDLATGPLDEEFQNYQKGYYTDIGALAMWARGFTGINPTYPITVAVIDTGADLDHPDIASNLITGYDFIDNDTSADDESSDSHGSKVAGIIAARMNNDIVNLKARGVAGIGGGDAVAGTEGLRIMPIRVAQESSEITCSLSAQAIEYAASHGAQIINISYGGTEFCQDELAAIQAAYDAGVAIVAGAGNGNSAAPFYPAAYGSGDNENLVIAVAGLLPSGAKADGSNYGSWVDVGAPFRQIRSITKDGGYASDSGTSFSAPFVSGLLGILMSNFGYSRDSAIEVVRTAADNVDTVNTEYPGQLGAGRINANRSTDHPFRSYVPIIQR